MKKRLIKKLLKKYNDSMNVMFHCITYNPIVPQTHYHFFDKCLPMSNTHKQLYYSKCFDLLKKLKSFEHYNNVKFDLILYKDNRLQHLNCIYILEQIDLTQKCDLPLITDSGRMVEAYENTFEVEPGVYHTTINVFCK